jgi:Flp pilus assembly protein TadB
MDDKPKSPATGAKSGLAAVGIGIFAVACCAGGPLIVAVAGGIALGSVLGVAAGVVALVGLSALVVARARRRRACAAPSPERTRPL